MSKVYIGVGHGGTDPGAVSGAYQEKNLTLAISLIVRDELVKNGVTVCISRTNDMTFPTGKKVPQANAFGADLVADIHINAGGGKGAEVYHAISGGVSKTLAQNILDSIVKKHIKSIEDLETKQGTGGDYFGIIRDTKAPAVLVECAFIDSPDVQYVASSDKQEIMGKAIAQGILKTLGAKVSNTPKATYSIAFGGLSTKGEADSILQWVQVHAKYIGKIEEEK